MPEARAVSRKHRTRSLGLAIGFALLGLVGFAPAAGATAISVTTTIDSFGIDNGTCSLREAVHSLNNFTAFSGCAAGDAFSSNSIDVVAGSTYNLTLTGAEAAGTGQNDLDVLFPVTIQSLGSGTGTKIVAPAGDRVFDINSGTSGVTIRGIRITGGAPGGAGGGIQTISPLTLTNVTLDGNNAGSNGGAISFAAGPGTLSLENVTITGNSAVGKAGGLAYSSSNNSFVENSTIINNTGDTDESGGADTVGGGIGITSGAGIVNISNTILAQNFIPGVDGGDECGPQVVSGGNNLVGDEDNCTDRTDGVNAGSDVVGTFFGGEVPANVSALADFGGPVFTRPPLRTSPAINRGYPGSGGGTTCETTDARGIVRPQEGRCDIGAVEISGAGDQILSVDTTLDQLNGSPTFSGTCTLREAITAANLNQATGGCPAGVGGARDTINVPAGTYTRTLAGIDDTNVAGDLDVLAKDPAIASVPSNPVTIQGTGTTLTEVNAAGLDRVMQVHPGVASSIIDGISMRGGSTTGSGGGLHSAGNISGGSLTMNGNFAGADGGGAFFTNTAGGFIGNITVSGNQANGNGGGMTTAAAGAPSLNNVTVTLNTADANNTGLEGSGGLAGLGDFSLSNSIVAGNTDTSGGDAPDCGGTITSAGYNLIGTNGNCNYVGAVGDQVGTNGAPLAAGLGGLADNGGRSLTHAPAFGSLALNAGHPVAPGPGNPCSFADQRGVARPQPVGATACDAGSVEVNPAAPVTTPPATTTTAAPTGLRAAALKKCKKKYRKDHNKPRYKKCKKRANLLPL